MLPPPRPGELAWARQTDRCVLIYVLLIAGTVTFERLVVNINGRAQLEGWLPMLELAILVGLTYDGRSSWTSRFCNWCVRARARVHLRACGRAGGSAGQLHFILVDNSASARLRAVHPSSHCGFQPPL